MPKGDVRQGETCVQGIVCGKAGRIREMISSLVYLGCDKGEILWGKGKKIRQELYLEKPYLDFEINSLDSIKYMKNFHFSP